jgi:hypothetical protein
VLAMLFSLQALDCHGLPYGPHTLGPGQHKHEGRSSLLADGERLAGLEAFKNSALASKAAAEDCLARERVKWQVRV